MARIGIHATIDAELVERIKNSVSEGENFSKRIEELLNRGLTSEAKGKAITIKQALSMVQYVYDRDTLDKSK